MIIRLKYYLVRYFYIFIKFFKKNFILKNIIYYLFFLLIYNCFYIIKILNNLFFVKSLSKIINQNLLILYLIFWLKITKCILEILFFYSFFLLVCFYNIKISILLIDKTVNFYFSIKYNINTYFNN